MMYNDLEDVTISMDVKYDLHHVIHRYNGYKDTDYISMDSDKWLQMLVFLEVKEIRERKLLIILNNISNMSAYNPDSEVSEYQDSLGRVTHKTMLR